MHISINKSTTQHKTFHWFYHFIYGRLISINLAISLRIAPSEVSKNISFVSLCIRWKLGHISLIILNEEALSVAYWPHSVRKWISLPTIAGQWGHILSSNGVFGLLYHPLSIGRLCALILRRVIAYRYFILSMSRYFSYINLSLNCVFGLILGSVLILLFQ